MTPDNRAEPTARYRYSVSLRLRHPVMPPDAMTGALGRHPDHSWQAGEARSPWTGGPTIGVGGGSFWTKRLAEGAWPPTRLADAIGTVFDRLSDHRDFFLRIRAEGGEAELFIGWFLDDLGGEVLPHGLLGRAAGLELDLSFDLYPLLAS